MYCTRIQLPVGTHYMAHMMSTSSHLTTMGTVPVCISTCPFQCTYFPIVHPYCKTFYPYSAECSTLFFYLPLLTKQISFEYIRLLTCTYSLLLICAIHVSYLPCLELPAPRPNSPLSLVHLIIPELAKLLVTSISLHPTLKDSLLIYLNHPQHSHNSHH